MRLLHRLLGPEPELLLDIASDYRDVCQAQMEIIKAKDAEISALKLEYTRWGKGIIENFLIALDKPEDEDVFRELLAQAVEEMSDEIARIEEHAP